MSDKSDSSAIYNIIALCFAGRDTAERVLDEMDDAAGPAGYRIAARAVVEVDEKGKSHIKSPARKGTAIGAAAGGVLGLVGGPVGLLAWAAVGGLVGGLAQKYIFPGVDRDALHELGEWMQPDTSTVLVLVEDSLAEEYLDGLGEVDARIVTVTVGDELSGEIATAMLAGAGASR